ncbi:MAG: hypothetical protein ACK5NC_09650 [Vibrio sp.]
MSFLSKKTLTVIGALSLTLLTGCSSYSYSSHPSSRYAYSNGYGYNYANEWWYNDYWYYQDHAYPHCCHTDEEMEDALEHWWDTLDDDEQDEIRDKVKDWRQGDNIDLPALRQDIQNKYDTLPADKKQALNEKREEIRNQMNGMSDSDRQSIRDQLSTKGLSDEQKQAVRERVANTNLTEEQKQAAAARWQNISSGATGSGAGISTGNQRVLPAKYPSQRVNPVNINREKLEASRQRIQNGQAPHLRNPSAVRPAMQIRPRTQQMRNRAGGSRLRR